jgi:hypothetical protein
MAQWFWTKKRVDSFATDFRLKQRWRENGICTELCNTPVTQVRQVGKRPSMRSSWKPFDGMKPEDFDITHSLAGASMACFLDALAFRTLEERMAGQISLGCWS